MELLPLVVLLGIMYFLLIRPQQQRVKAQRALVRSIAEGDDVATIGGILGRILTLDDEQATIETTPGTILRIRRGAIAARLGPTPDEGGSTGPIVDEG
jgi:preprotein translocase subunit YajC